MDHERPTQRSTTTKPRAKIDDILNERPSYEKERILPIIEGALSLLDELKDEPLERGAETIRQGIVRRWSLFTKWRKPEGNYPLATFLDQVCEEAGLSMQGGSWKSSGILRRGFPRNGQENSEKSL